MTLTTPRGESLVQRFLNDVHADIGDPYVFGAAGPKEFDCSGLIYYNLRRIGIKGVPRTSEEQWKWVQHIHRSELQPGDLIFMNFGNEVSPGHVVIYAGNNRIIQAPHPGADVQEVPLSALGNGSEIVGYGRVPGLTGAASPVGGDTAATAPALGTGNTQTVSFNPLAPFDWLGGLVANATGAATTIGDLGTAVGGIVNDLSTIIRFTSYLFEPQLWLRVGAFFGGLIALGLGLVLLTKALGADLPTPTPVPI